MKQITQKQLEQFLEKKCSSRCLDDKGDIEEVARILREMFCIQPHTIKTLNSITEG